MIICPDYLENKHLMYLKITKLSILMMFLKWYIKLSIIGTRCKSRIFEIIFIDNIFQYEISLLSVFKCVGIF